MKNQVVEAVSNRIQSINNNKKHSLTLIIKNPKWNGLNHLCSTIQMTHYTHAPWGTNTLIIMKYCANGKTMCGDADSRFRLYGL